MAGLWDSLLLIDSRPDNTLYDIYDIDIFTKLYTKAKYVNMRRADRETLPGPGEVGEMTNEEIKKRCQRKYPEVPDETYNVLITPVRKPIGLKHLTSAFYMMKEYEGAEDGTLKRHLLTLSLTHQKVFELVRDGVN